MPGLRLEYRFCIHPCQGALSFDAIAVCRFGDRAHWEKSSTSQTLNVFGIGKFSHLSVSKEGRRFDFGDVFIGSTSTQSFVLANHSNVSLGLCQLNAQIECLVRSAIHLLSCAAFLCK